MTIWKGKLALVSQAMEEGALSGTDGRLGRQRPQGALT